MYALFVILHVLICLVLCVVILLQSSKGGGLAGAFGGGGAPQQIFGARGMTTILHKMTIYGAIGFFLTSATLFGLTAERDQASSSAVQKAVQKGTLTSDVTPPAPANQNAFPALPAEPGATGTGVTSGQEPAGQDGSAAATDKETNPQ